MRLLIVTLHRPWCLFAVLAVLFGSGLCPVRAAVDFVALDADLRAVITNKATSDADLLQAISRFGRVSENPGFWTTIANDESYTALHRSRCVFALFRRHGNHCSGLRQLGNVLAPANWLLEDSILRVENVIGWVPVDVTFGDTIFRIELPHASKDKAASVYIRIAGKVTKSDFIRVIRGLSGAGPSDYLVQEYGYADDYENWLRGR